MKQGVTAGESVQGKQVQRVWCSRCGKSNVSNSRGEQVQQAVMSPPTWDVFPPVSPASSFVRGKTTALINLHIKLLKEDAAPGLFGSDTATLDVYIREDVPCQVELLGCHQQVCFSWF